MLLRLKMIEICMKFRNILSQVVFKGKTHVLHIGSGNIGWKKRREDVATFVPVPRTFVQDNSPKHYFPSQAQQYPVTYYPYPIFSRQPIAPPSYIQWCAPIAKNYPPPFQVHQNTANIPFLS